MRKPLIVMSPKSLLRHKQATSTLEDLTSGQFQPIIPEQADFDDVNITRLVLCSGKVYYDLIETREHDKLEHVAIIRVEQLYPFPLALLTEQLQRYPQLVDVVWCQEEPQNQGAWHQLRHRLVLVFGENYPLHYAGRNRSAAPAVGDFATHIAQQKAVVESALYGTIESGKMK